MRLNETVNIYLDTIYESDAPIGVFEYLDIQPFNQFERVEISLEYYLGRSGFKLVTPLVENLYKKYKESISGNPPNMNELLAKIITNKYSEKWSKIRESLYSEYTPINNIDLKEVNNITKKDTHTDVRIKTITYDTSTAKNGNYKIESNGSKSVDETVIRNNENLDNTFGFNTIEGVPQSFQNENNFEHTTADKNSNTIHDLTENESSDTTIKTGSDTFGENITYTVDDTDEENKSKIGRTEEASKILDNEIMFRTKNIFLNIIFDDIDSILCSQIY